MTLNSVREYAAEMRKRYLKASKKEKGKILNEFVTVTGYHRKAAIRLLLKAPCPGGKRRGRPASYERVVEPLKTIWEASDRLCSRRLKPFMPELIRVLKRHGELQIDAEEEALLVRLSPSTIDRLLAPARRSGGRKPPSTTQPGSLLKGLIPIRTFADWEEDQVGFLEIDLVAHCGEMVEGFYLNTLCAVDVASGWTECLVVWGKGQERVKTALHRVRGRLPFPLLGIDSDNGSEFINRCFYNYCRQHQITFTRSRSYRKNDSCHVEQKNGRIVRRLVGYDRYTSKAAYQCLERLYGLIRLYVNFFQPTMKLVGKTRQGARVHRVYDTAQTPYQRLLKLAVLSQAKQAELAAVYQKLSPIRLLQQINSTLEQLWKLAEHPARSVTRILKQ